MQGVEEENDGKHKKSIVITDKCTIIAKGQVFELKEDENKLNTIERYTDCREILGRLKIENVEHGSTG